VAVIWLAYANSLRVPFLFDDVGAVTNNPTVRRLDSWAVLQPPADGSTTTGRPLVNLTFALNYALSGEAVWSYHATNLAIHSLTALLLFGLVRRALGLRGAADVRTELVAGGLAMLWGLHPLQTESVVGIAQRTEVLCGFFYLLTLYAFLRGVQAGRTLWLAGSVMACLAGMAAKEVMVTAPVVVVLFDRTFVAGSFGGAWRQRRAYYVALASTWLVLAALLLQGGGARGAAAGFGLGVTPWAYLLKQSEALVLYLRLAVWPHPLVVDYGTAVVDSAGDVAVQGLIVLLLLVATLWALVRRPVAGFFGACFFLILAPSSSFVPLVTQSMAEHRMYLPLAAIVVGAGVPLVRVRASVSVGLFLLVAAAFGVRTAVRNADYRDALTLWSATVADYPTCARAHQNLALVLRERGDSPAAHRHYARAVELDPRYATAHYNWGVLLLAEQRTPEAIARFESALRLVPGHLDAAVNLGIALVRAGRAAEAIPHFEAVLRLRPAADVRYNLGVALIAVDRREPAVQQLEAALRMDPRLAGAYVQLGRLREQERRLGDAERHYRAALELDPAQGAAHARLGLILARSERLAEAAEHLQEAVRQSPDDADTKANLGNVFLLQGRTRAALTQFEAALQLRPGDARLQESVRAARAMVP